MVNEGRLSRQRQWTPTERRVLDAVDTCCTQWGWTKTTIDDIARVSGVSRATLYRLFPGGRDVVFEAHRVRALDEFFATLIAHIGNPTTLDDLVVRTVTCATRELRADENLAAMLASEPGLVVNDLTFDGLPRIVRVTTAYLVPFADRFLPRAAARRMIDVIVRLVISYFLAPSDHVDLADEDSARDFLRPFLTTVDAPGGLHPHESETRT